MARSLKRYTTAYKKRVDVERDTYLPRRSPKGLLWCTDCGSVYYRRRWTLTPPQEIRESVEVMTGVSFTLCAACRKIRDHYPSGELQLIGVTPEEKDDLLRLLKIEEERARVKNPLERMMEMHTEGPVWKIATTTEKLAQRLGRSVQKARGGKVAYNWSHNNKFVRVVWEKKIMKKAA
jgi:hypothetical protein